MPTFLTPMEVDKLLKLSTGKAKRLAKRGKLPVVILPDGTIRFDEDVLHRFLREGKPEGRANE